MTEPNHHPVIWDFLAALAISVISGAVSISRRIASGHQATWVWIISEFLTAILCGYLMYNAYPAVAPYLPSWCTLPVAVAFVAHSGGRVIQELENTFVRQYAQFTNRPK